MATSPKRIGQWKVLLIAPDPNLRMDIRQLLEEYLPYSPVHELQDYPTRAVLEDVLSEQSGTNLCLVDSTTNREWAQSLLGDLAMLSSRMPTVALHGDNDPAFILRTLRAGATEVLLRPFSHGQFMAVLERLATMKGARKNAKLFGVIPAKGACGATTVACNLAYYLRKIGNGKVLLADLDPLTGTVSFQLKLKSAYSFMDAIARVGSLDEDVWKGLVASWNGLDVLLAPDKPVHGADEIKGPASILEFSQLVYDVAVADTNSPFGQWSLTLAHHCDELLLITTNELPSVQATQRALAYLERQHIERSKIRIVLNRYAPEMGLSQEVIEAALHTEVYHTIPSDYVAVNTALVEGRPLPAGSPVGRAMQVLAEKLSGKLARRAPQPKTSSLTSLLSFLKK